jgi:2-methylisocitrate lyase-like PEP mutase family enzyme
LEGRRVFDSTPFGLSAVLGRPVKSAAYAVTMTDPPLTGKAAEFLSLHRKDRPLLQPNAHDAGSARLLESLGFEAIATTSSGFSATLARLDGSVTRDEVMDHCSRLSSSVRVPVAADTENGFAEEPEGVAETVSMARGTGLAGCSIEDYDRARDTIYDFALARERVAAAAEAARRGPVQLVLTARAENHIHGRDDLADTIRRLQAYQEAGADVLFAPGVTAANDIRSVVGSVDRPVNVLALPGCPPVSELAAMGVARVSVGGAFSFVGLGAFADAAIELRDEGTYGYLERVGSIRKLLRDAFGPASEARSTPN